MKSTSNEFHLGAIEHHKDCSIIMEHGVYTVRKHGVGLIGSTRRLKTARSIAKRSTSHEVNF